MDKKLRALLEDNWGNVSEQYELAGIGRDTVKDYILREMKMAAAENDWESSQTLLSMARSIVDKEVKADTFNHLLDMPGHYHHQEVTMEIQRLRNPSSVPYIRRRLEGGFKGLEYTNSEDAVIAKWFSHALAQIDTDQAIDLIEEFSRSENPGVAGEMKYRLSKIGA